MPAGIVSLNCTLVIGNAFGLVTVIVRPVAVECDRGRVEVLVIVGASGCAKPWRGENNMTHATIAKSAGRRRQFVAAHDIGRIRIIGSLLESVYRIGTAPDYRLGRLATPEAFGNDGQRRGPLLEDPASCDEAFVIGERLVSPR